MNDINKKDWLQGLILMAINSTVIIKNSVKRHEYALKVSKDTTEIILEQIDNFDNNNHDNKCVINSCLYNGSKKCYFTNNKKWRNTIEDVKQCPFLNKGMA